MHLKYTHRQRNWIHDTCLSTGKYSRNMKEHLTLEVLTLFITFCLFCTSSAEDLIPVGRLKDCNKSFDKAKLAKVTDALEKCEKYEVGKKIKFVWFKDVALKAKTDSALDCQIFCLTNYKCLSFVWSSKNGMCRLLTKAADLLEDDATSTSGMRHTCIENIDPEIRDYFSDPFLWQNAVKNSFLEAKRSHDGSIQSRINYSREVHCLKPLIEFGAISEDEMGVAPALRKNSEDPALKKNNEVPFLPLEGAKLTSIDIQITGNSGRQIIPGINTIKYKNWIITGLYAQPGKIITVTSPQIILDKFLIKIGAHSDKNYGKDEMNRDPDITEDFTIKKEIQAIGSPYGGLIFVIFPDNSFEGQVFELKFENVLKAPHFVLGRDTNEDWNSRIKTEAIPWTVFEIPKKIAFVVPSRGERGNDGKGAYQLTDVTFNLNEWSEYMDKNDEAAGIVNRPSAELVVVDSQIVIGSGHNGYPIMKVGMGAIYRIFAGFPEKRLSIFNSSGIGVIIGHEIGHNMQLSAYLLSHVSVNLIFFYAMPAKRVTCDMCRQSKLYSYIKAGKPVNMADEEDQDIETEEEKNNGSKEHENNELEEQEDSDLEEHEDNESEDHEYNEETKEPANNGLWGLLLRMPLDGLDGSGWGNDAGWDDLPAIYASYRKLQKERKEKTGSTSWSKHEKMDLWVKTFCEVKKMNMLPYFEFWNFVITKSTKSICQTFSETPTELMSYISHIETLAKEEDACLGDGWFGTSNKCFKISDEKFNYERAIKYCKGLGDSATLAEITDVDEAVVVNYEILKFGLPKGFKRSGIWIESVGDTSVVFPYAKDYNSSPDTNVILGKYKNKCHFDASAKENETTNCVGPLDELRRERKYKALCEKKI